MSELIDELAKEVGGKDIYIIGGGKSFNPSAEYVTKIPKDRTICLNSALQDFDTCLACMFMDSSWQGNNKKLLDERRQKYALRVNLDRRVHTPQRNDYIMYLRNSMISRCSFGPNYRLKRYDVCGNNIGVCAIDLMDQMGAKNIYLFGFDCTSDGTSSHYHNRYRIVVKQKTYDDKLIPCFNSLAEHLKKKGTHHRVINFSRPTNITSLQSKSLEDFDFP